MGEVIISTGSYVVGENKGQKQEINEEEQREVLNLRDENN